MNDRMPSGFRRLFQRAGTARSVELDIDDEMRFHIESRVDELVASGMSAAAAREQAAREYGDLAASRHELAEVDRRRLARVGLRERLSAWSQDLRYAARGLRRQPGFSLVVVLTLALAIGANATMFGIVDRLLLRGPMHVTNAERVRRVHATMRFPDGRDVKQGSFGYVTYTDIRDNNPTIMQAAGYTYVPVTTGTGAEAQRLMAGYVTWDFFPLLGTQPARGRFFGADEDRPPSGERVAVLDYRYWVRVLGADPRVVGSRLELSRLSYQVVGIAPEGFTGAELRPVDIWLPMSTLYAGNPSWPTARNWQWMQILVRLTPDVTYARADEAITLAHQRGAAGQNGSLATARLETSGLDTDGRGNERPEASVSRWVAGVAVVVLLIACANIANLLLARASRRRREIAVRLALGVSRARLLRLLIAEGVLLAGLGGLGALAVAAWAGPLVRRLLPPDVAWDHAPVDWRVLAFTAAVALLTGLVTGLAPALQALGGDLSWALKSGSREGGSSRSRLRTALLVAQPALSFTLLIGAGLFIRSLAQAHAVDLGVDVDRVLTTSISWPDEDESTYEKHQRVEAQRGRFLTEALARFEQVPWVEAAGLAIGTPFGSSYGVSLKVPGRDSIPSIPGGGPYVAAATSGYFTAMGMRVLRGRVFTSADNATSERVTVVNQTMAAILWPDADPLGQCLLIFDDSLPCARVVGVVHDVQRFRLKEEKAMQYWVPFGQEQSIGGTTLMVRPRGDHAEEAVDLLRRELQNLRPDLPYARIQLLSRALDPQVRPWVMGASMFSLFGALALVVAAVGLYSVIAYIVEQRTPEFGVRIALGASGGAIVRQTLRWGLAPAVAGLAIGAGVALYGGRWIEPLLFETSARDARVFLVTAFVLGAVAVLAALVPAWRATRVDPVIALRAE